MTKLSPFFKYFGSKYSQTRHYPAPVHSTIIESFAGSAGYSLNYPGRDVILVDSDERVIRVWNFLIRSTSADILALPLLEPHKPIADLDICDDAKLLISCCANTTPFRRTISAWKNGTGREFWGEFWRARVAAQVDSIRHWRAICCDYSTLENIEATWFIDPPYQHLQQHYRESKRNPIDFAKLGDWCRSRNGQVIVCEQHGADWLPFRDLATVRAVRNKEGRTSREVVWTND